MTFLQQNLLILSASCDRPEPWQLSFQDPASPVFEGIINLHHDVMTLLLFILGLVSVVMGTAIYYFNSSRYQPTTIYTGLVHNTPLEFVWTLIPCLILLVIAIPSFALIYSLDDIINPKLTIKVIGHQWYWTYEYGEIADDNTLLTDPLTQQPKNYDSYLVSEDSLDTTLTDEYDIMKDLTEVRVLRLYEVDNRLLLPSREHIRFLITSADVLHSWSVPSLGIKIDACPGRLNQFSVFINRPGVFYGQCSEICGVNHGFMPIVIEVLP